MVFELTIIRLNLNTFSFCTQKYYNVFLLLMKMTTYIHILSTGSQLFIYLLCSLNS